MRNQKISNKNDSDAKYDSKNIISQYLINNFYDRISRLVSPLQIDSLLEVGCGAGFSTQYLKRSFYNAHIEASDVDSGLVADAQCRNPDVIISQESIYSLNRTDQSFDLVVCLEVLEHLERPDEGLRELKRVANKYLIVSVPDEPLWRILNIVRGSYWSSWGNPPEHINHWTPSGFYRLVSGYFDIVAIHNPLPWTIILAKN